MTNWAIIKSGSKQYKVAEGDKIAVEKLNVNGEKTVNFDEVLLLVKEDKVEVGKPLVEKAKVKAKVLENFREQKVKVVKLKSRYLRIQGHRQNKTRVQIEKISAQIPK